mmetsp:Transcript_19472/g.54125  ORF Transcript_19472/g.54125 Transcript_19472/m.54125 type:complete len:144 (-) Transcript_19472:41-472(-)
MVQGLFHLHQGWAHHVEPSSDDNTMPRMVLHHHSNITAEHCCVPMTLPQRSTKTKTSKADREPSTPVPWNRKISMAVFGAELSSSSLHPFLHSSIHHLSALVFALQQNHGGQKSASLSRMHMGIVVVIEQSNAEDYYYVIFKE